MSRWQTRFRHAWRRLAISLVVVAAVAVLFLPTQSTPASEWPGFCNPFPCVYHGTDCGCDQCVWDPNSTTLCDTLTDHTGCVLENGSTTARAYCQIVGAPPPQTTPTPTTPTEPPDPYYGDPFAGGCAAAWEDIRMVLNADVDVLPPNAMDVYNRARDYILANGC